VFDCTVAAHLWLPASNSLPAVLEEMGVMTVSELGKPNPTWAEDIVLCGQIISEFESAHLCSSFFNLFLWNLFINENILTLLLK